MTRIRFVSDGKVQIGSSPENITTYGGEPGSLADVHDDIAALLIRLGYAGAVSTKAKKTTKG